MMFFGNQIADFRYADTELQSVLIASHAFSFTADPEANTEL
jgi:hypothetical protein